MRKPTLEEAIRQYAGIICRQVCTAAYCLCAALEFAKTQVFPCGYYATMLVARARNSCMPALQIPADCPLECSAVLICLCDRMHRRVKA